MNATLLAVALLGAIGTAPLTADTAEDDPCEVLGSVAETFAHFRDQGSSRELVASLGAVMAGDDPGAARIISGLVEAVYADGSTLDGEVLRLLTVKACRQGLEEQP